MELSEIYDELRVRIIEDAGLYAQNHAREQVTYLGGEYDEYEYIDDNIDMDKVVKNLQIEFIMVLAEKQGEMLRDIFDEMGLSKHYSDSVAKSIAEKLLQDEYFAQEIYQGFINGLKIEDIEIDFGRMSKAAEY